jgi:hypothetical protein
LTFQECIDAECAKRGIKPTTLFKMIGEKAGMSSQALRLYYRGAKVGTGDSATKIVVGLKQLGIKGPTRAELMGFEKGGI